MTHGRSLLDFSHITGVDACVLASGLCAQDLGKAGNASYLGERLYSGRANFKGADPVDGGDQCI